MALPHGAVGRSEVCNSGITRSYSLAFFICQGAHEGSPGSGSGFQRLRRRATV